MPSVYNDNRIGIFDAKIIATKFDNKKSLDITSIVGGVNITSALNHQTISGNMSVVDDVNLLNNEQFSFVGEEFIDIVIKKPNTDDEVKYRFVAASLDQEVKSSTIDSSLFTLTLLSIDSFINAGTFKSAGYSGPGSDIIKTILQQELKTEVVIDDENFEAPDGKLSYAFTKIKPLEKISILTSQVYKNKPSLTSTYMFYENRKGYNFETYERIMERAIANNTPTTYTHTPLSYIDRETNYNSIVNYNAKGTFNNFKRLYHGMYNTELLSFNFITKELKQERFNLLDNIDNVLHLNRSDPGASDAFRQSANNLGSFSYLLPFDSSRDDLAGRSILYSSAFSILLSENTLAIKTFGNLDLDIGDAVNVEILDNSSVSDGSKSLDKRYSGKYIVFAITLSLGASSGGMEMFNNMFLVNDGAFRQASYYNKLYTDENPNITIPALIDGVSQQSVINNSTPLIVLQANSSNQV